MTTETPPEVPEASGLSRPLRADAERNRQRVIAAARHLFAARGLDVSLDDVADEAGVGVGTVYRRFANREELILGVFVDHLKTFVGRIEKAVDNPDPWQGLVDLMEWAGEMFAEDRGLAAIVMSIDHNEPQIQALKRQMGELVSRLFNRAHAAGVVRPDVSSTDFFGFFTMLSAVAEKTEPTVPGLWRRYLGLLIDAISAEKQHRPLPVPAMTDEDFEEFRKGIPKCQ